MIIYQVLPRLWGRGKLSDWQDPAFAHLRSLGCDAVWYTGIIRHSAGKPYVKGTAGSPYSIVDYRDVNPYLADNPAERMKEFEGLVARTHAAGLRVFIDFVPNHVSPDCRDVPVHPWCDFDWTDTRKVDYSRREAWDDMLAIALFWASKGVDGFRCDMVELVPPEFLSWLIRSVREAFPGFIFIGEAYEKGNYFRFIRELGFDYLYDKSGFYDITREILCHGRSASALTANWQWQGPVQGSMLNFLENHDEQRLASPFFAGSPARGYAALAYGALFGEASFMIYAGQELGETAAGGYEGRTSIFDFTTVPTLSHLWSHISEGRRLPPAEARVLARYKAILAYAGKFRGLRNWDLCYCQAASGGFNPSRHSAFARFDGSRAWVVLCNFSPEPAAAEINIPDELRALCAPFARLSGSLSLSAAPFDAAVLKL